MFLKNLILPAVVAAAATFGATSSDAASCTVGSCGTIIGADGQALSGGVAFDINTIGEGTFQFTANFLNDQPQDAVSIAVALSGLLGEVTDLVLEIVSPVGIAASYALAPNTPTLINLVPTEGETISFILHGESVGGKGGLLPDVNLFISAVPLPAGALLMGTALAGFGFASRRRRKA